MPGDSGVLVVTRVRSTTIMAHEAAGATGARRSPRPLRAEDFMQSLGRMARRGRERVSGVEMSTLVMPGLDPGIHQIFARLFSKKMDCRVEPGNDGVS
jgi:hypothetical protein